MTDSTIKVFRNVCPRNCYNTCAMISHVKDGNLIKVSGDPKHGYTQGRLCAKGYAYTRYVYHPDRIRFPLRQYPRGSGKWERITWEQAIEQISEKMLALNRTYGSNLPIAYNKCSGNIGLLNYAIEGMFNSIGAHTKPIGNPCLSAGQDAISYDFGQALGPDPENMADSKLIIIWGANPAWTAIHQLKFINSARQKGAKVVVIDPLFTPTAAKADLYLQIRSGTDGLLALMIAKLLIEQKAYDQQFVQSHVLGFEPFYRYLTKYINLDLVSDKTGLDTTAILELTSLLAEQKPCSTWIGFGLQRNANGGQNIRAINALMAITGNIVLTGGGLYYLHLSQTGFPQHLLKHQGPEGSNTKNRLIDLNSFASKVLSLNDPPVKLLWVAGRNPLSQDQNLAQWDTLLQGLDLIVTVDLFMTKTASMSDLLLPAASHFEEYDINVSYWHHWLALNEKAIEPYFEAKSDLQIARDLTQKLNQLSPGFSNFPYQLSATDWLGLEFTDHMLAQYGLNNWNDLKDGPRKLKAEIPWTDKLFSTQSGKFEIYSYKAKKNNLPAISKFVWPKASHFPLRLLSPQYLLNIHSQRSWVTLSEHDAVDYVIMSITDTAKRDLEEGNRVTIYNNNGAITRKVHISRSVPAGVVVAFQGGETPLNTLISNSFTDMGTDKNGSNNVAFYDIFVDCKKSR